MEERAAMTRLKHRIRFSRWGLAENPIHAQIVTDDGKLYDVIGTYRRECPSAIMLQTRHFNGELGPDLAASSVWVLDRA
jgi:hypothetical protein